MNKKILMLLQSEFPPDIRLEKEIKTLSEKGYDVLVLCNQYEKGKSQEFKYCKIERLHAHFENVKFNKIFNFPLFLNPRFFLKVMRTALYFKPDFIHAHDMPMVPIGFILKKVLNKPLIYDMHENYPEALREFKNKGILNFIFKNPKMADFIELFNLRVADKIITVVEENRNRLILKGVDAGKIVVVSNTIDLETFVKTGLKIKENILCESNELIIYTGTVSPDRGLETPIKAMEIVKEKFPNATLLILGDGTYTTTLSEIIDIYNLKENVSLIPWCGHDNLWQFISKAKICIIPQPSNSFIDNTIPHKLFEYMSFEKPVLVSDAKSLKRIITETKCGLYFKSQSVQDCASKIIELLNSNDLVNFGRHGRNAVEEKYNWNIEGAELIRLYNDLVSDKLKN